VLTAELQNLKDALGILGRLTEKFTKPEDQLQIYLAKATVFEQHELYANALLAYDEALVLVPNDIDVLYARGMLGDKMNRIDIMEENMLKVISIDANNAHALNSLGFTLADRTGRYEDALKYIQRAFALKPNDYFILDSMGWVMYRLERYDESIQYLKKALESVQDPEIAAHLTQALWKAGKKTEGREILDSALKISPNHPLLLKAGELYP
jgi:tetratricopeptide (TPR) repeat protein